MPTVHFPDELRIGVLAGIEDHVSHEVSHYTNPDDVEDFVKKTGVDSLAISIGTSHGASSVVQEYVEMINRYGGKMESAVGVPEDQLRKAARSAVCKINIDTDGRLVLTAVIRKCFAEDPKNFDPRGYLGPAREELTKLIERKNKDVLGSAGRV